MQTGINIGNVLCCFWPGLATGSQIVVQSGAAVCQREFPVGQHAGHDLRSETAVRRTAVVDRLPAVGPIAGRLPPIPHIQRRHLGSDRTQGLSFTNCSENVLKLL